MNRRQFLLASACAAAAGCGNGAVPFGGSPQAPQNDNDRIVDDLGWRALEPRVRSRDWVDPHAMRTVAPFPVDFVGAMPQLASLNRSAILFHPRYSDEPSLEASKLGGTFLWPSAEPWPTCPDHPELRLVTVLQLRSDDFPEVGFREGADLLQVLWCPREHERCWARPALFWRDSPEVNLPLQVTPASAAAYPGYVPLPCRLFAERVSELPEWSELGRLLGKTAELSDKLKQFRDKGLEEAYARSTPYGGWKLGGWPNWVQAPQVPVCRCGSEMELLLSYASEFMHLSQAPVQERHLYADPARRDVGATENAANAPRLRFADDGVQFTFICRHCPDWPIETISQC